MDSSIVFLLGSSVLVAIGLVLSAGPDLIAVVAAFTVVPTLPVVGPYVVVRTVTFVLQRQSANRPPLRSDAEPNTKSKLDRTNE